MRTSPSPLSRGQSQERALLLLGASALAILVLTLSLGASPREAPVTWDGGPLTAIAFLLVLALAMAAAAWHERRKRLAAEDRLAGAEQQGEALRLRLQALEAGIGSEAQSIVVWDGSGRRSLARAGLERRLGVPEDPEAILELAGWLEPQAASQLRPLCERLTAEGKSFNLVARTLANAGVEIDGRASSGHAVLRIRDVSAQRRAVVEAEERNRRQAKDAQLTRALFEALPMPVWFRSPDGRIDWVNSAYVRAVDGLSREDVRARQTELLEARQRKTVEASLKGGRIYRERVHVIVCGERRSYDLVAVPQDGASALIASDAAALETAEGELSRQIAAHDRTLDRVSTAVAIFGPDQRLSFSNEAYRKLWQLDPAWLQSRPRDGEILDRLRERRQLPEQPDYRLWKRGLLDGYGLESGREDRWYLPNGRTVHVVMEQRTDGGVTYLYDDVTERLALEGSINALSRVQKETLDNLKEGVAVFATDGRLRLFNLGFARIWRLNPSDLGREPHIEEVVARCRVLYGDAATWARIKRAVTSIQDQRQRLEGQMVRPDESVIAYGGLPLPDGAMLLTFADVTDSKRAERMLTERNEALVQADRLKSQFISHVSYELRTPLTNIIGFSELLASPHTGSLNGKQLQYLHDIGASSKTLLAIINDILDLATIDAGAFELKLAPVSVEGVIKAAAAGVRERLMRTRMTLEVRVAEGMSEFLADENRVKQVLFNLLSNAIGFSEAGDTIHVDCRRETGMVVFQVRDEGVGIPLEHQAKIFERFESRTQGSRHRGAGLGLALVKSLVELHGGSVALQSEPGKGTTVTVRFPEGRRPARLS